MSRETSASRAALLELRHERGVIEDGHRFLDEKRVLLAHEILRRLADYEALAATLGEGQRQAFGELRGALGSLGLEELQLYPARRPLQGRAQLPRRGFLGVELVEGPAFLHETSEVAAGAAARPVVASAPASACGERLAGLAGTALALAAETGNLLRLLREYRVTERRVRALENVVLPEVREAERRMEETLEEVEQEDVIRVRLFASPRGGRGDDR
ncbi:MAG TPA: V-type ATP synthase subunit D [Gammaproteobacteria bacterium]|nr:V-type ATP synthase subunit D [Gammaproteobacteria bacterium]